MNKNKETICDYIDKLRVGVANSSGLSKEEKLRYLSHIEKCQELANKIELKLFEKVEILLEEGYVKCRHCKVWGRPQYSIDGPIYSCCKCLMK